MKINRCHDDREMGPRYGRKEDCDKKNVGNRWYKKKGRQYLCECIRKWGTIASRWMAVNERTMRATVCSGEISDE